MAGFTTTNDGSWVFNFGEPERKPQLSKIPNMATNYLEGAERWDNYSDDVLYECEYLLRAFFEEKKSDPLFMRQQPKYRRFTVGMMHEILFGEKYDTKNSMHQARGRRLSRLMSYYSTRIQKEGTINGKKYTKKIYTLSPKRYARIKPFSLKLRTEWLAERGELPTWNNMRPPIDKLEPGHARNPRTDKNMEMRRERAKAEYNAKYGHRKSV